MSTVYLFYKSFCILKIEVALISCMWSKVRSKAGENNGLTRPPAESVPGLNNREIAPISSPHGVGVENQTTLASPFGKELVGVIWLTLCSAYADQVIRKCEFVLCGLNGTYINKWDEIYTTVAWFVSEMYMLRIELCGKMGPRVAWYVLYICSNLITQCKMRIVYIYIYMCIYIFHTELIKFIPLYFCNEVETNIYMHQILTDLIVNGVFIVLK